MRPRAMAAAAIGAALSAFGAGAAAQAPPVPTAPAAAPPPAAYPPNLNAGGLVPPPSGSQAAPAAKPGPTEQALDAAKQEDSRRKLEWFWINAGGGLSFVDMRAFSGGAKDFTEGFVKTQSVGGSVDVGLGGRFLFFTIGARGRYGLHDPWQLLQVGGEIGLHFPLGRLEPHLELGGGYATTVKVAGVVRPADVLSLSGGYGRLSGGVDVYLVPRFSVGVTASGDFLALGRPALTAAQIDAIKADATLTDAQRAAADGLAASALNFGVSAGVTVVLGVHF